MITKEEAIEHLKNIKIYSFQDGYTDEAREALDMAIKALEAQERQAIIAGSYLLEQLPSAQPVLTCKGCKYDYYECVQCLNCLRKERDLYEPE